MSGDSSLGIGIGLALKSYGRAVSYVKIGRVLDLSTPFSELTFTLEDKSGEGNDATLYSGRYISTDGSTDRGIVADCSAAGVGSYYLTGKVRPNAVTTAELTMDGSTDSGLTGLTADVWQTFTTATSAVTPSAVQVGYDGSTASAADWSDVKLIDSSDGSTVARWQLNESADGDLNGYPALDSSGNGYHGTHTGCAGGTGEGIDADVIGAAYAANEDKMYFDGVDDYVSIPLITLNRTTGFKFDFKFIYTLGGSYQDLFADGLFNDTIRFSSSSQIQFWVDGSFVAANLSQTFITGNAYHLSISVAAGGAITITNEETSTVIHNSSTMPAGNFTFSTIGDGRGGYMGGSVWDIYLDSNNDGTYDNNWNGYGNTNADWLDQIGSNNGTVNGSPATVGQKRATILQTAGMDWNKRMWFDGVDDEVTISNISLGSGDWLIGADIYKVSNNKEFGVFGRSLSRGPLYIGTLGEAVRFRASGGNDYVLVLDATIPEKTFTRVELRRVGTNVTAIINGALQTNSVTISPTDTFDITQIGARGTVSIAEGVIYNAYVDLGDTGSNNHEWVGSGNTTADWEDQIGSKDGTVVGSPSNLLIPASDSTPSNDALGNAIVEPRPTADTWNLFGDGEYGQVASDPSYQFSSGGFSIETWINLPAKSATIRPYISLRTFAASEGRMLLFTTLATGDLSFLLDDGTAVNSTVTTYPSVGTHQCLVVVNATDARIYIDGALASTPSAHDNSWTAQSAPLRIGKDIQGSNTYLDEKISRPKIYNRALTADEVLQNFNAQKSAFGL